MTSIIRQRLTMLNFCLQSCLRAYGRQFFQKMLLPHPVKTTRAFLKTVIQDYSGDMIKTFTGPEERFSGRQTIIGVGFCLKPTDPPCPSGRSNRDCQYFEVPSGYLDNDIPESCRQCVIREIGVNALKSGSAFYIMTSARDILFDVFIPALEKDRFSSGLFALCRYSFEPFAVGLLASGIRGCLFPYQSGDCSDYRTWLQADRGIKDDQTIISDRNHEKIIGLLKYPGHETSVLKKINKIGNIFYSE